VEQTLTNGICTAPAQASRRRASAPLRRKLAFFLYNEFGSQYNSNWVRELRNTHAINTSHLLEFVQLWGLVRGAVRRNDRVDTITWKLSPSGEYLSKSAYKAQFVGSNAAPALSNIWRTWAPPKCKLFAWFILQNRVWSSDRLARRGWPHSTSCTLYRQTMETALHLLADYRFTRIIWESIALWIQGPLLKPSN